jgi:hypothetical protein
MSTIVLNELQLGQDSITQSNNFVIGTPASPDGTLIFGTGVSGNNTPLATLHGSNANFEVDSLTINEINSTNTISITINGNEIVTFSNSGIQQSGSNVSTSTVDLTASGNVSFTSTGALKIPSGTTAENAGYVTVGMLRYDTTLETLQIYKSTGWVSVGGVSDAKLYYYGNF